MLQTVWAVIREGKIEPLEKVSLPEGAKAIVTFLSDEDDTRFWLSASEYSLAEVWENDGDDIYANGWGFDNSGLITKSSGAPSASHLHGCAALQHSHVTAWWQTPRHLRGVV